MSQPIRGQGGYLVFPTGPKNTNLVEGVEILLPVKFRWIAFSGFRGEVENVKVYGRTMTNDDGRTDNGRCAMTIAHLSLQLWWANKRPKGPHIVHLSTMCHLFGGLARVAILFFRSAEKHKLGRGHWDLASCQVSLNSVQRFQRRSQKCLSQSEARAAILFFRSAKKTQTW